MASPTNYGAGITPLPRNSDTTQTDQARVVGTLRINTAHTPKGLAGARSSITSAKSEQPLPAQNNSTRKNGFIAWLCNCCKRATDELPRQEAKTGRPKQDDPPISLIRDFEEMPRLELPPSGVSHDAAFPPRSRALSVEARQATPDTQGIRGVQKPEAISVEANSSDVSENIPPRLPVLLDIPEGEESEEEHENGSSVVPSESRDPQRDSRKTPDSERTFVEYPQAEATFSAAPRDQSPVLANSPLPPPPPVEESSTAEPALQPATACDLVAQTAPALSSTPQQGVAATALELQQPIQDSFSV